MTRRSALVSGLLVLLVLLGGQVVSSWQRRPPVGVNNAGSAQTPPTAVDVAPSGGSAAPVEGAPAGTAGPGGAEPGAVGPGAKPPRKPKRRTHPLTAMGVRRHTGSKGVALTFDDGPHPVYTPKILAQLRKHRVKAVFCVVGTEVRRYPKLVARIAREGHTLCNHSWHHELQLGRASPATIRANLARTNAAIRKAVPGARIPYYRQPGGLWTPAVVHAARGQRMIPLGWSVDPSDWEKPPAHVITARVLKATRPGSVVLLHDAGGERGHTIGACRSLIPSLKRRFKLIPLR